MGAYQDLLKPILNFPPKTHATLCPNQEQSVPINPTITQDIFANVILPTAARLKPHKITVNPEAEAMLLAIGLQESALTHRYQVLSGGRKGPARGLWQFERGGGVKGVLSHPSTTKIANIFAVYHAGTAELGAVHARLEYDDILACAFARLLLYTDPRSLPQPVPNDDAPESFGSKNTPIHESQAAAWEYYLRNWRPGKPHPNAWPANWQAALNAINS